MGESMRHLVLILSLLVAMPALGEDKLAAEIADELLEESTAPGVGVAYRIGDRRGLAVRGLRAAGADAKIEEGDLWHIGSITKSMTALIVARLATRGEIRWDDTVKDVLGQRISEIHPDFANASWGDLLRHRSGMRANLGRLAGIGYLGRLEERDVMEDRLRITELALADAPLHKAGETFAYSNLGYLVAGTMLEVATGRAWEDLIREEVFLPLGLRSAGFGAPGRQGRLVQPQGHAGGLFGGWISAPPSGFSDNPPAFGPAGTVHMSLGDLLTYLEANLERPESYLSQEAWARMHDALPGETYALGWAQGRGTRRGHEGSNSLWFAHVSFWAERERALVLVANAAPGGPVSPAFGSALKRFTTAR